jgi:molybdopterin-containing oxidoreductase family membrane subunit
MWLERLNIIVPTLANPRLPYPTGFYIPSVTEISIFLGCWAFFCLGYIVFARFFPLITVWEIQEARKEGLEAVRERVKSYLPDTK